MFVNQTFKKIAEGLTLEEANLLRKIETELMKAEVFVSQGCGCMAYSQIHAALYGYTHILNYYDNK